MVNVRSQYYDILFAHLYIHMYLVVIAQNEHFQYLTPAQELVCFSVANFFI